jgi:WD40 repeat protein/transcriptional regulator with XRE-family HTH domain
MTGHAGTFGERLRACRAAAWLSQEELAERSGLSVRAIGDIERGQTRWPYRDSVQRLANALGLADQEREGFLALAHRPTADLAEPEPVTVPYRGLSAFREQDAGLFFGREDATARVLELMSAGLDGSGLIVVSGVSGAGKSSLLRAGVLPRLRQDGLPAALDAASWPCLVFTPGRGPLAELAVRIAPLARTDAAALRQQLATSPAGFALTVRQAALAAPAGGDLPDADQRRVVLVIDQCEQLFTACQEPGERQAFIAALHAAAGDGAGSAAVVMLVVRADFEARLADYPQLSAVVQDRYLLTAMTRRQLRLAITQPAAAAGSGVEEDLVQVLLEEAGARAGGPPPGAVAAAGRLPLLSHALDQAWRMHTGTVVTLADYERTGGIEGAVAASAQRAYQALTPAQQETARQVFTRLTATGSDGTDTAIPAARADLTAGTGSARPGEVEAVLERFAAERLLTLDAGTVAISHEVLLTAWPLLRDDWLADARADRIIRTRLHATATEWVQDSRDPSYLYSGSRLDAAAAMAARIKADPREILLSQAEKDFLHASHRAGRRRARTRRQLIAVLLALAAALATVWIMAVRAEHAATTQRDIAVSRQLISESEALSTNPAIARLEAIAAWALSPSAQAHYAMLAAAANPQTATITADPAGITSVAFSPNGKTLATGGPDSAQLLDVATGRQTGARLAVGTGDLTSFVAFSPNGKTLATGGDKGAQLWDVATGRPASQPLPASRKVGSVAFSPDGKILATGGPGGIALWDVATGDQLASLAVGQINSVAFSPDGKILATGGDNGVRLWDVATGRQAARQLFSGLTIGGPIGSVAFSPDGKTLAAGRPDGRAWLWDLATGRQVGNPLPAGRGLSPVAFSPDSKILATGGDEGVRLWDVATGRQIGVTLIDNYDDLMNSVAFSPDGKTLATGSPDGRVRLWDVAAATFLQFGYPGAEFPSQITWTGFSPDGKILATNGDKGVQLWDVASGRQTGRSLSAGPAKGGPIDSVAFSPDGTMLATGSGNGTELWDVASGRQTGRSLSAGPTTGGPIDSVTFSPDGTMLATGSDNGMQLWEVATGDRLASLAVGQINSVAFSPDGKILATGSDNGAQLWDMTTNRQIGATLTNGLDSIIDSVAFSPDGKTLATGGPGGIALWDVATGDQLASLAVGQIDLVAFSPDGKTLATAGSSGARLWYVATDQQIGVTLTDSLDSIIDSVAFSPDGKTLATGGPGGTALWDVSYLTDPLARLCAQAGGSLTPADWSRYVQAGTPYQNACH